MSGRAVRLGRSDFRLFRAIPTRWADNDAYGHVNNVIYYSWFDTAVNAWLIEQGHLDLAGSEIVGLVVETACTYFESVAFPETIEAGIAVEKLGRSSVTYRIGIFRRGGEQAAAQGRFTHVYVARAGQKPAPIPDGLRDALQALAVSDAPG
ncbi:acyl-CoA thioesterase [Bosea sp. 2KB_26]|uniref:acyl-CoA thioesterase n=1 Tax=Bosea sp. 2KB_26 TaxID=3237475 RepID=UPI003F90E017